jgi:hypothetical protein
MLSCDQCLTTKLVFHRVILLTLYTSWHGL